MHEELNTVLAQTAQEAVGSESLLLVLGALQVGMVYVCARIAMRGQCLLSTWLALPA